VFTAQTDKDNTNLLHWSVVSMPVVARYAARQDDDGRGSRRRKATGAIEVKPVPHPNSAAEALDPPCHSRGCDGAKLTRRCRPAAPIIVSDQGINGGETGEGNRFHHSLALNSLKAGRLEPFAGLNTRAWSNRPRIRPREQTKARDAFDRLTFLGWGNGLAAIVRVSAASFFLFGYALVYWRNADMDFMIVYNALLLNDGEPQQFVDHPAYITILSVCSSGSSCSIASGLLDASRLSDMPLASNAPAFDAVMTSAVRAGRLLAWLTATGCVLAFAGLMRLVVRDWRVALIATFAFAFSGGRCDSRAHSAQRTGRGVSRCYRRY